MCHRPSPSARVLPGDMFVPGVLPSAPFGPRSVSSTIMLVLVCTSVLVTFSECAKLNTIALCGLCGTETFACGSGARQFMLGTTDEAARPDDTRSEVKLGNQSMSRTTTAPEVGTASTALTTTPSPSPTTSTSSSSSLAPNYRMNLNDKLQRALLEIRNSRQQQQQQHSQHESGEANHADNCTCIPLAWRCDGAPDCADASDEIGCDKIGCPSRAEFSCSTSSICIDKALYCNGVNDCGDDSDEMDCSPRECDIEHETRCDNGRCIPSEWLCDDHDDCGDQSDERCRKPCESSEFQCESGDCIPAELYCNNRTDCEDNSDEASCTSTGTGQLYHSPIIDSSQISCPSSQMMCNNGLCISESYQCDGDNDCGDWSDENICDGRVKCRVSEFQCSSGQCINTDWRCDGDFDCDDQSDELNCPLQLCSKDEFRCRTGRCIRSAWRCDGDKDCEDNSDEEGCAHRTECTIGNFRCRDGTCVSLTNVCNGAPNCPDGSDEDTNSTCLANVAPCQENGFPCQHLCVATAHGHFCACKEGYRKGLDGRSCIDINECVIGNLKNEHFDYLNGLGLGGGAQQPVKSHRNTQHNIQVCSQLCENSVPGYQCSCVKGYRLRTDKRRCKAVQGHEAVLLVANINDLSGLILDSSLLLSAAQTADNDTADVLASDRDMNTADALSRYQRQLIHLDYLYRENLLFWIDPHTKQIYRASLELNQKSLMHTNNNNNNNGQQTLAKLSSLRLNGTQSIVRSGLVEPSGLAVDWINLRLYWTDAGAGRVEYCNLNGSWRKVLFSSLMEQPNSIVVDAERSTLYWANWGETPRIESAFMDGTGRRTLVSSLLSMPTSLVIDFPASKLYWVDVKLRLVECANLDGSSRYTIVSESWLHPISLTIFEDNLYWTNLGSRHIHTISKLTGRNATVLNIDHEDTKVTNKRSKDFGDQIVNLQVKVYHSLRQVESEHRPCRDHACSHLCLPNNITYRCSCPFGFGFEANSHQQSCSDQSNALLVFTHRSDLRALTLSKSAVPLSESDVLYHDYNLDYVLSIQSIVFVVSVDYDLTTSYIYWIDLFNKSIARARWTSTGEGVEMLVDTTLEAPSAIAYDWLGDNIYWTDTGRNVIEAARADGRFRSIVVWKSLDQPRDIVLDPSVALMFWTQWSNQSANIERASMDGSNRVVLHSDNMTRPHGLAIDTTTKMIYWTDSGRATIEYSQYDGAQRRILISRSLRHPFAVTIHGDLIYWSDLQARNIQQAHKLTGDLRSILLEEVDNLMDLTVLQYNVTDYAEPQRRHQQDWRRGLANSCSKAKCAQLCLLSSSTPSGYRCACATGIRLLSDGHGCAEDMDKYLIITTRKTIRRVSLDTDYHFDVNIALDRRLSNALILDVHRDDDTVYWSDTKDNVIYRANMLEGKVQPVITFGLFDINGLAIDNIGHKLYWTDAGRKRIEVADLDGNNRRVLINSELDSPRAIAVNHPSGHMVWSDWGEQVRIERADMDGSRRAILVNKDLGWPNGITITKSGRIVWADSKTHTLEMIDMNGANRHRLVHNLPSPYGVAMIEDYLYWTDWQSKAIYRIKFDDDQRDQDQLVTATPKIELFFKTMTNLVDVRAIDRRQTIGGGGGGQHNMCQINNGGCSHLCLRNSAKGYSCLCPTGMTLLVDNKTCLLNIAKQIFVATAQHLRRISLEGNDEMIDVFLPFTGPADIVSMDYHFKRGQIFYVDAHQKSINSLSVVGCNLSEIATAQHYAYHTIVANNLGRPSAVAIDWIADNIYWCDQERHRIEVARLDGSSRKVLLDLELEQPRALVLLANVGYLFWINSASGRERIERAYLDGSGRTVLVDSDLERPVALAVDNGIESFDNMSRLYWSDEGLKRIESILLDGTYRQVVIAKGITSPMSIAVLDDYVYWVDVESKVIERANRWTGENIELVLDNVEHLRDLKIVTASRQVSVDAFGVSAEGGPNPCGVHNGGCSNLCLFRPHGYICACPSMTETVPCSTVPGEVVMSSEKKMLEESPPSGITNQHNNMDNIMPTSTLEPPGIDYVPKPNADEESRRTNHSLLKKVDVLCQETFNHTKCQQSQFFLFTFDNEYFPSSVYFFGLIVFSMTVLVCVVVTCLCRRKTYTNKSKTFEEDGHEDDKIYESDKLCDEDGMMMLSNGLPEYVPPPPPPPIRPMFDLEYLQHPFGLVELRPSDMININRQQQQQQLGPAFVQTLQRYPKDPKPFVVENGDEGFHPFSTLQRPRYTECALDEHIITTHSNMSMKMNTGSVQNVHNIVGLAAQPRQTDI